jgi:hypothetical protein
MGSGSWRKVLEQPMNRGDKNHTLAIFGPVLKVLAKPTISAKQSKGALYTAINGSINAH